MRLQFGDIEGKQRIMRDARIHSHSMKAIARVVGYYERNVKPANWPKPDYMHLWYPPWLRKYPLSVLSAAAKELQTIRRTDILL